MMATQLQHLYRVTFNYHCRAHHYQNGVLFKGTKRQQSGQISQHFQKCKNYRITISQAN